MRSTFRQHTMFVLLLLLFVGPANAEEWKVREADGQPGNDVVIVEELFQRAETGWARSVRIEDPQALLEGARSTLTYMRRNADSDPRGVHPGILQSYGVTVHQVEWTLSLLAQTAKNNPEKLQDSEWLERNFDLYLWKADATPRPEPNDDLIRLTKYVVYEVDGSTTKTERFAHALWQVPTEELYLSDSEAELRPNLLRYQLTRQEILNGALQVQYPEAATPLIWLERENVHEAILQGTIAVRTESGEVRWFNVHRSNNLPYKRGFPAEEQDRYWFFRPVTSPMGWGWQAENKIGLFPYASVAGDVDNFGIGKVFWLQDGEHVRLVILSDTGGAFQPNLHQLDWFVGVVSGEKELQDKCSKLPPFVRSGILIAK